MLNDIISGFVSLFRPDSVKDDRRRLIRLRCRFDVFLIVGKEIYDATIIDMGLKGVRLESSFSRLKPNTMVSLVYRGAIGEAPAAKRSVLELDVEEAFQKGVHCQVSWSKTDKFIKVTQIGLVYKDTPKRMKKSWIKNILREIGFDEDSIYQRRRIVRVVSSIPCRLQADAKLWTGRLVNIGAGGALFQSDEQILVGQIVKVVTAGYQGLSQLKVRGQIVTQRYEQSSHGWLHGVRFIHLDTEQVDTLGKYVIALLREQTKA